jgi:hypothetical protein
MNNPKFKSLYEENKHLVTLRESTAYPGLFVLKYKREVFFKGLWNPFLEEARGLVVDKDFNIVSRPFLKIYNYVVEKQAPVFESTDKVQVFRKVNGFMVAATFHNKELIVSTTGSLDSDFATLAASHLQKCPGMLQDMREVPEFTFIFECCDPTDPHIVEETPGLYFIGLRHKDSGAQHTGTVKHINQNVGLCLNHYNILPVEYFECTMGELQEKAKTAKHEGFVFYKDGVGAKIKSPYYLTKKMLMRKNMAKLMAMDAKEFLDEEFYPLIEYIREVDRDHFTQLDETARREYIEKWFTDRAS